MEWQATGAGVCATRPDGIAGDVLKIEDDDAEGGVLHVFFCVCRIMSLCPLLPLEVKPPVYRYTAMLHGFGRYRESSFPKTAQKYKALTYLHFRYLTKTSWFYH